MKKKILSVLLCLCMALTLLPATVWAANWAHAHYLCGGSTCNEAGHKKESGMTNFITEIKQENGKLYKGGEEWNGDGGYYVLSGGNYYLSTDLTLCGYIKVQGGVTLCLNGNKITGVNKKNAIELTGGSFTLTDCQNSGTITHAHGETGRGVYVKSGTFNMYGGSITNNNTGSLYSGGGVYVDGGSFEMTGGSITNNNTGSTDSLGSGGGVYVTGRSTFKMTGGSITGNNTNNCGGGVHVDGGSFEMSGGTISSNTASGGGGVYVYSGCTFKMTGGSITGNNATKFDGGGVYVEGGTFTVSGNVNITGNTEGAKKGTDGKFAGGTKNNVYLHTNRVITIGEGGLLNDAQVGVTLSSYYGDKVFTSGWNANMSGNTPSDYFISDVDGKGFELSDGEVKLCDGHTHFLCGGDTCNGAGHKKESGMTTFAKEIRQDSTTGKLYKGGEEWTVDLFYDSYALDGGVYYLSTNLTPDHMIQCNGNVTLCLNGHSITANHKGDVIAANSGVTFTLTDCKGGDSNAAFGKITHASGKDGRGVYVEGSSTTFNMYGGSIASNNMVTDSYGVNDQVGGGVYIAGDGATFNMYDGTICGNTAGSSGGGVYMGEETNFNMYGGTICGNTATRNFGGGVCVYKNGNFNMSGGEICDNGARCGGGVYVSDKSTFTMTGGSITGNNVSGRQAGGGIYISASAKNFTVSGNIQITGNMKQGAKNENGKYTGGTAENLYLPKGKIITIGEGGLLGSAKLGVTLANNYGDNAFTFGWTNNMSDKTPSDYFISDTDGYVAKLNGSELKMVSTHVHNWTYAASGNTITATCESCEDNNGQDFVGGTAIITASPTTYNGNPNSATVSKTGIFENVDMSISYSEYDAADGQYQSINFVPSDAGGYMASITYEVVTAHVEYIIAKATRYAPTVLEASPADSVGGKGKINGTTTGTYNEDYAMEYNTSPNAATGWIDCTDGSTEVAPGTYYVRYKESRNYFASSVSAPLTVGEHTHTCTEKVDSEYLKSEANCQSPAVYYKSCSECGVALEDTFESGNLNPNNHTDIVLVGQKDPTCCEPGNIGREYCRACSTGITTGREIPATGEHVDADGKWESDGTSHWHTCYFGTKFDQKAHSGGEASCNACAVCEECGQPYGAFDSDNHKHTELRNVKAATEQDKGYSGDTWCLDCGTEIEKGHETDKLTHQLKEVAAKAATAAEQGNIKHYFCSGCGKYYADAEGKQELTREQTLLPKLAPEITEGGNTTVSSGEKKALTFRSDAAFADFLRVELDGKTLDEKNYTKAEGGIVVTLNGDFVATLSVGEHTLSIVSQSGTATAKFTVNAAQTPTQTPAQTPKTGDSSVMAVWSLAAILSLALGVTVVSRKKREG